MGVFPADHLITKEARFRKFVKAAYKAAETSKVVVLGIQPRWAETGYGYIEFPQGVTPGAIEPAAVTSFREKPDEKTARKFMDARQLLLECRDVLLENLKPCWISCDITSRRQRLCSPDCRRFEAGNLRSKLAEIYPLCDNISVDYAHDRKDRNVSGIALDDIGWNDVGSWEAVYDLARKDKDRKRVKRRSCDGKQQRQLCRREQNGCSCRRGQSGR